MRRLLRWDKLFLCFRGSGAAVWLCLLLGWLLLFLGAGTLASITPLAPELNPQLNDLGSFPGANRKVPWDLLWLLR